MSKYGTTQRANIQNMTTDMTANLPASNELSPEIGVFHLKRFWAKAQLRIKDPSFQNSGRDEWNFDVALLDQLGIGIEEAYRYLSVGSSSLSDFEQWILSKHDCDISKLRIDSFNRLFASEDLLPTTTEPTLTKTDLEFWRTNGYVVIPNAISKEDCKSAEQAIWTHLGMQPDIPETWYKEHPDRQGIMIQLFRHKALERNRFSQKIRKAYEQLWGSGNLIVSNDRVSFNPPETESWHFPGPYLHWDVSLTTPIPFGLQGLLYLTDTTAEQGAFRLVPGFHHHIEEWLHNLPDDTNPRGYDLESLGVQSIAGNAGDFVIWHQALPHGSGVNTTDRPRIVQYINWLKIDREHGKEWI